MQPNNAYEDQNNILASLAGLLLGAYKRNGENFEAYASFKELSLLHRNLTRDMLGYHLGVLLAHKLIRRDLGSLTRFRITERGLCQVSAFFCKKLASCTGQEREMIGIDLIVVFPHDD